MPTTKQSDATFQDVNDMIYQHLAERDWQNGPARGLAISIALEASELVEHYQWSDKPVGSKDDIAEELADIFIYAFQFAHTNEINIVEAIEKKLEKAAKKYPAEMFKGKSDEEREKNWIESKLNHRKTGL